MAYPYAGIAWASDWSFDSLFSESHHTALKLPLRQTSHYLGIVSYMWSAVSIIKTEIAINTRLLNWS